MPMCGAASCASGGVRDDIEQTINMTQVLGMAPGMANW